MKKAAEYEIHQTATTQDVVAVQQELNNVQDRMENVEGRVNELDARVVTLEESGSSGGTIPVQADWASTSPSSSSYIKNKPSTVSAFTNDVGYVTEAQLNRVAFTGSYDDLDDKPPIPDPPPVGNGTLTIKQGGQTLGTFTANTTEDTTINIQGGSSGGIEQVQADWDVTDTTSKAYIQNKPSIPRIASDLGAATTKYVDDGLRTKQDELTFDETPTEGSTNPVTSSGIKTALDDKASVADVTLIPATFSAWSFEIKDVQWGTPRVDLLTCRWVRSRGEWVLEAGANTCGHVVGTESDLTLEFPAVQVMNYYQATVVATRSVLSYRLGPADGLNPSALLSTPGALPKVVSQLQNDVGYLTQQDLSGKASLEDVTLMPVYSNTPRFAPWVIYCGSADITSQVQQPEWITSSETPHWQVYTEQPEDYILREPNDDVKYDETSTHLSWIIVKYGHGQIGCTATRQRLDVVAYRLGSEDDSNPNKDKLLALAGAETGGQSDNSDAPVNVDGLERVGGIAHDLKMYKVSGSTEVTIYHELTTKAVLTTQDLVNPDNADDLFYRRPNTIIFGFTTPENAKGTFVQQTLPLKLAVTVVDNAGEVQSDEIYQTLTNNDDVWIDQYSLKNETAPATLTYTIGSAQGEHLCTLQSFNLNVNATGASGSETLMNYSIVYNGETYTASVKIAGALNEPFTADGVFWTPNDVEDVVTTSDLDTKVSRPLLVPSMHESVRALTLNQDGMIVGATPITALDINGSLDRQVLDDMMANNRMPYPQSNFEVTTTAQATYGFTPGQLALTISTDVGNLCQKRYTLRIRGAFTATATGNITAIDNMVDCLCRDGGSAWKNFYELDMAREWASLDYHCGEAYNQSRDSIAFELKYLTYEWENTVSVKVSMTLVSSVINEPISLEFYIDPTDDWFCNIGASEAVQEEADLNKALPYVIHRRNKFATVMTSANPEDRYPKVLMMDGLPITQRVVGYMNDDPDYPEYESDGTLKLDLDHKVFNVNLIQKEMDNLVVELPELKSEDTLYEAEIWLQCGGTQIRKNNELLDDTKWVWVGPKITIYPSRTVTYFLSVRIWGDTENDMVGGHGVKFISCWKALDYTSDEYLENGNAEVESGIAQH